MKAALGVNTVSSDLNANLAGIEQLIIEAADAGADIALFPEAAVTGLSNNDNPAHDLALGQPIPGPITDCLSELARTRGLWLAIGVLEREGNQLYDSAVLIDRQGEIALKYRRIQPQWHSRKADPRVYCQGTETPLARTPLGSFAFLICGDLFDTTIVKRVRDLRPDWVLFPFARNFPDNSVDQERWAHRELPRYLAQTCALGVTTLMVNYLAVEDLGTGFAFGGALAVSSEGEVTASLPLGRRGILVVDV